MTYIAGLLTVLIILNCLLLIFLILVQLPKKDAGAGLAFGGGAADALFGAGSGNALTKITKWATVAFVALALLLGFAVERTHRGDMNSFKKALDQKQTQMSAPAQQPATAPASTPPPMPLTTSSNAPAEAPAVPASSGTNATVK